MGKFLTSNWPWPKCVSLDPSYHMPFEKDLKIIFRPHFCLRSPIGIWKGQKIENLNFVFAMSKFIQSNLKDITFKKKLHVIYRHHGRVLSLKWLFWSKMLIMLHLAFVGQLKPFKFSITCLWCSSYFNWNTF